MEVGFGFEIAAVTGRALTKEVVVPDRDEAPPAAEPELDPCAARPLDSEADEAEAAKEEEEEAGVIVTTFPPKVVKRGVTIAEDEDDMPSWEKAVWKIVEAVATVIVVPTVFVADT